MPKLQGDSLGYSSETKTKQEQFSELVAVHMRIVKGIQSRYEWASKDYTYIDMNSGCGKYLGVDGSPIIVANQALNQELRLNAICFELNRKSAFSLESAFSDFPSCSGSVKIINGNHNELIDDAIRCINTGKAPFGMIYNDPDGTRPSYETIAKFSRIKATRQIDVVIYVAATNIKRRIMANPDQYSTRLLDGLNMIDKKHWIIRKPRCAHQWTFVIGTNWWKFPEFRGKGFYSVESNEGRMILDELNLTRDEFKRKHCGVQISMFDYQKYLRSDEFREVRRTVISRSGGACEVCLDHKASEVHHIRYPKWGMLDTPENLIAVCHPCHCKAHGKDN